MKPRYITHNTNKFPVRLKYNDYVEVVYEHWLGYGHYDKATGLAGHINWKYIVAGPKIVMYRIIKGEHDND